MQEHNKSGSPVPTSTHTLITLVSGKSRTNDQSQQLSPTSSGGCSRYQTTATSTLDFTDGVDFQLRTKEDFGCRISLLFERFIPISSTARKWCPSPIRLRRSLEFSDLSPEMTLSGGSSRRAQQSQFPIVSMFTS